MDDVRNLSGISVNTGTPSPVSEVPDAGEVLENDQRAFHDALGRDGEPNESQSPETRKAIKRSLDRFQASSGTEGAKGSGESEVADASRGRSTRPMSGPAAEGVAGHGPVPEEGTRRASDAGGEDLRTAQGRSRRADPTSPRVDDGRDRGAAASSLPSAKRSSAAANRAPPGAASKGAPAEGQTRAGMPVEPEGAPTAPTTGARAAPPRVPGDPSASRTHGAVPGSGADDAPDPDIAAIDMTGMAGSAGTAGLGQARAPEGVQAPVSHAAEFADEVADRILVSMPDSNAAGEVRISLKQSILDGSEVRIFREGGELEVVFVARTESAERLLVDIREQFQQRLGERLQDQRVHVEVEASDRGGASEEDDRRRSRQQYVRQDDPSDAS